MFRYAEGNYRKGIKMTMSTLEVGNRLVELVKEGENRKAIEELYADDAVHREAMGGDESWPQEASGKQKLLELSDRWFEMFEVHGGDIDGPYPHDDAFICMLSVDVTGREGPMKGQRMEMKEAARYEVRDGKITRADFYYHYDC
ncbi:MAG: nuclear transport factor 2 family protein [Planctomycetota bacterium]